MKKLLSGILGLVCLAGGQFQSVPAEYYMLPYPIGKTYGISQGNYDDPKGASNLTHVYQPLSKPPHTTMMYAYDFLLAWGDSIVAPAPATVAKVMHGDNYGFGNLVVIAYEDGTYGKFCHMADQTLNGVNYLTRVTVGQKIMRGQLIGFCGTTGHSTGPHLHYQRQSAVDPYGAAAQSIQSSFVEVRENGGRPIQNHKYTSFNYFATNMFSIGAFLNGWRPAGLGAYQPSSDPFAICYDYFGAAKVLGTIQSEVHQYPRNVSNAGLPWCQDFLYVPANGAPIDYTMVLDPFQANKDIGFQGVCYTVEGQMRAYWMLYYGTIGSPASYEYNWQGTAPNGVAGNYLLQWFQNGLTWTGVFYASGKFQEVYGNTGACFDPSRIFTGTGQLFCMANCPTGGGNDYYGTEEDSLSNTTPPDTGHTVVPPDTGHTVVPPTTYPFQYGFTPVQKAIGEFDGLVICRDTTSAATSGAESYHKLAVDTGSVFPSGKDVYYFAMYRHVIGKFRLLTSTAGPVNWNNFSSTYWDSTGPLAWDYCPQITREAKPPAGNYTISCYLDQGSGSVLMESRTYKVLSDAVVISSQFSQRKLVDGVAAQDGQAVLTLGSARSVSLHIYDLAGRERKSLNGFYAAGQHRLNFNLKPGIYLLRFNGVTSRLRMM